MNWGFVVATLVAIVVGAITNELGELAPSLAHRVLRLAAYLEASGHEERGLLLNEMAAMLDEVPGKLTKLLFSIGRLTYALRHMELQPKRIRVPSRLKASLNIIRKFLITSGALLVVIFSWSETVPIVTNWGIPPWIIWTSLPILGTLSILGYLLIKRSVNANRSKGD